MNAYFKGKLTISKTEWIQDLTGGKKEQKIPIAANVRFVARESRLGITPLPGKDGTERNYKFWIETKEDLLPYNLSEYSYIHLGTDINDPTVGCYKIISIQPINTDSAKYGWEILASKRN